MLRPRHPGQVSEDSLYHIFDQSIQARGKNTVDRETQTDPPKVMKPAKLRINRSLLKYLIADPTYQKAHPPSIPEDEEVTQFPPPRTTSPLMRYRNRNSKKQSFEDASRTFKEVMRNLGIKSEFPWDILMKHAGKGVRGPAKVPSIREASSRVMKDHQSRPEGLDEPESQSITFSPPTPFTLKFDDFQIPRDSPRLPLRKKGKGSLREKKRQWSKS